eukprot:scaffold322156_cov35-Tisochrysis_lutea.AAC.1
MPPADIVVLDENIDIDLDDDTLYVKGSELACELRGRGFMGIVCILTGTSEEHLEGLAWLPWVDYVFDKSTDIKTIGNELSAAYANMSSQSPTRKST